ncbi:hypothetical protein SAMN04487970_102850 [Paenibacillus tianmuensis]|uniref:Tetratricopeptide repeat-containing protein n=1 Tax=Paenibacillus tianmuensis TaxID=624147 RepID=A0A1G4SH56_9BACL|nr:hypothetical protein [Paenibacillus tianmuensis]SCW68500.1 hypothetical protein SAMN04487970_102850 [Paenibacillus tianmuensis]
MEAKDVRRNIDKIRSSRDLWKEFEYQDPDVNYFKRYAAAVAIQYDWKPEDYDLIKFLMENEVESRIHDPYGGCGDSLTLISYLLAKFRRPENVWLFEKAKSANFDTHCAYFDECIFSAGVELTCKYLEGFELTETNTYLFEHKDQLNSLFSEQDIGDYFHRMTLWFPDSMEKEKTESLLIKAIDFDDLEEAERLFDILEKQAEPDVQTLYYRAKELKKYEKAIFYKQKELELTTDARDKVSFILDITELHILNNDYMKAFESAQSWERLLTQFDSWQYTGLGRSMSESWFDICLGFYKEKDIISAQLCYRNGDWMIRTTNNFSLNVLEKALACSKAVRDEKGIRFYKKIVKKEQRCRR